MEYVFKLQPQLYGSTINTKKFKLYGTKTKVKTDKYLPRVININKKNIKSYF